MTSAANVIRVAMDAAQPVDDGRRARGDANRARIIQAMVELVAAGDPDPNADAVAEKAGLSVRTVFRHFEDKDAIFHAIDDLLVAAYQPLLTAPYRSAHWKGRLFELIARRCTINEAAAVFRISAVMERYRSQFIAGKYRRLHAGEKRMLDAVLPPELQTSTQAGRAILIACSFDTWRLLRQDEELSPDEVEAAIRQLVEDILAQAGAQ
ncbi:MAG: TetR/AcrR family transcriptional regulator [Sphingopyxis sp.]|nr:TetR/AcrR family transcriptional regulator [Sphingopyxis sp.]